MRQPPEESLTDLARAPTRLLPLSGDNRCFHLHRQLIRIPVRAPRPIREPLQPAFFIAFEDLVAGLARNPELSAQGSHALPVFQPNHKAYAFVHHRTFLPWHPRSASLRG